MPSGRARIRSEGEKGKRSAPNSKLQRWLGMASTGAGVLRLRSPDRQAFLLVEPLGLLAVDHDPLSAGYANGDSRTGDAGWPARQLLTQTGVIVSRGARSCDRH